MAEAATKHSVKTEDKKMEATSAVREWRPFEALHREIDRLFDDFGEGFCVLHSVAPCSISSRSGDAN